MKTTIKNSLVFIIILLGSILNTNAATYTSIANGTWDDVLSVWSTDGGATACLCTPGAFSAGNDINVNHNITATYKININGGTVFTVSPGASLTGGQNFSTWNSTVHFFGNGNFNKFNLEVGGAGTINLHPGVVILANNALSVRAGTLTLDGAVINSGGLDIWTAGTLNLTNSSRFLVVSGNGVNNGIVNIGPNSCMASNGNWKNNGTGTVAGTGVLNSGGNLQNSGSFGLSIAWCAQGAGLGLPTAEDCSTANTICNAIVLPVELINFSAELIDGEFAAITWSTVTEINNDYFILNKSTDGIEWHEIDRVDGAGNSSEKIDYSLYDYEINAGVAYYQLIQVDFDGKENPSSIVSINMNSILNEYNVYPNPATATDLITVVNLENATGPIVVTNSAGQTIIEEQIDLYAGSTRVDISSLNTGVYFIHIVQNDTRVTQKLIVSM